MVFKKFGMTLNMTGARWFMVLFGFLGVVGLGVYMLVSHRNAVQYAGAAVGVQAPGEIHNTPGKSSAAYAKQVVHYNQQRAQAAENKGESFVGIPVTAVTDSNLLTNLQQPKSKTTVKQQIAEEKASIVQQNAERNDVSRQAQSMAVKDRALSGEINMIATAFNAPANAPVLVPVREYVQPQKDISWSGAGGVTGATRSAAHDKQFSVPVIGDIIYAVMDNTAKSSIPGKVMATLLQAPFLKEKVIGSFTKPAGVNYLTIRFTTLVLPNGQTQAIDAYATSPNTTLPAMATSVNTHFFARAGAFLGATFLAGVEGYGQALSEQGQTVSTGLFGTVTTMARALTPAQLMGIAAGKAAQSLSPLNSMLQKTITEPNTVTVSMGEPFDLFVVGAGKN